MPSAAHTFGLHETLLAPKTLPPPPVRHALFASLVALTAILHLCTTGWSEIHNGVEGEYAAGARHMLKAEHPLVPIRGDLVSPEEPPLLPWVLLASYKVFGVTVAAARVPVALAMIALVAITFLLGEQLSGYWRGFIAGLILLCSSGSFVWGRMVTPEPLFAALIAGGILCLVGGYQHRQRRRLWFIGTWVCIGLAYLAEGAIAIVFLGTIVLLLALFYREARLRFRSLLHWSGLLSFLAIILPWHIWLYAQFPGWIRNVAGTRWLLPFADDIHSTSIDHVRVAAFLLGHFAWWFPILLLVLPGLLFAWRRVTRPHEIEFSDATPLCWMLAGFAPLLFLSHRQHFDSLPMWSALALWAACTWDRAPSALRLAGLGAAAASCAIAVLALRSVGLPLSFLGVRAETQPFSSIVLLTATFAALAAFASAAYLLVRKQETLATALMLVGMLPLDLSIAEIDARLGPQLSFAPMVGFLQTRLGDNGELIYEGTARSGSGLGFYLDQPFSVIDPDGSSAALLSRPRHLSETEALDHFGAAHPVYLILHKDRVAVWQARLTERFHLYHQVSTCGSYIVVNNQP